MSWFWAQRGAFARCINLLYARMSWLHSKAEIWVVNISIGLLRGRGTVVKGQSSLLADLEVASSNSG